MIVKTKYGYEVKSKSGKVMSKKNLSKKAAEKRIGQIEYFKHQGK
jgi:hypothetical protein